MIIKFEGSIYTLHICKDRGPYVGQSIVLDKDQLPTKRWKRHIADAYSKDPKKLYVHRAIQSNKLTYDTLEKKVVEYVTYTFEVKQTTLSNTLLKSKNKSEYKKYINTLKSLLLDNKVNLEEINEYLDTEEDLTEEELYLIQQIQIFINKLNNAEIKWVSQTYSMMPDKGGNGYNHAPPGGAFPHEPHTDEHKAYMSNFMSNRRLSDKTKQLLRDARIGKPLSEEHKNQIAKTEQKKFNEIIFPKRYDEWVNQYKNLGYSPNSNSKDIEERRAGQWRQDMIFKRKGVRSRTGLTQEQIDKLTNTPGWLWENPDEFMKQFENFKIQYSAYDGKLSTSKKDPENVNKDRAINWIRVIRMKKRNNHPYLTEDRIKILEKCDYWSWIATTFITFEKYVDLWEKFYSKNKRQPSMGTTDENEKKIARWQTKTRMDYHNKEPRLTAEKLEKISVLIGWTWKG
jgi:hypothetical protein